MHFGLVAFDLFDEMYREKLECGGQDGWPEKPSITSESEIPAAIIANNLYGIDIDLRAVQLSAMTLYLKAKELNQASRVTDSHLACADVLALNGERLNAFERDGLSEACLRTSYSRVVGSIERHQPTGFTPTSGIRNPAGGPRRTRTV